MANLLEREFEAAEPNLEWVTALTELKIADAKVYLSPIVELFDRSTVYFSVFHSPVVAFANESLRAAIAP